MLLIRRDAGPTGDRDPASHIITCERKEKKEKKAQATNPQASTQKSETELTASVLKKIQNTQEI